MNETSKTRDAATTDDDFPAVSITNVKNRRDEKNDVGSNDVSKDDSYETIVDDDDADGGGRATVDDDDPYGNGRIMGGAPASPYRPPFGDYYARRGRDGDDDDGGGATTDNANRDLDDMSFLRPGMPPPDTPPPPPPPSDSEDSSVASASSSSSSLSSGRSSRSGRRSSRTRRGRKGGRAYDGARPPAITSYGVDAPPSTTMGRAAADVRVLLGGDASSASASASASAPNVGLTNSELPSLVARMRIANVALCALGLLLEIPLFVLKALTPIRMVLAAYFAFFAALLLAFETHHPAAEEFLGDNFGFLFGTLGRSCFVLLMGTLAIGQASPLEILLGLCLVGNAFFTVYVSCRYRDFDTIHELPEMRDDLVQKAQRYAWTDAGRRIVDGATAAPSETTGLLGNSNSNSNSNSNNNYNYNNNAGGFGSVERM